MNYKKILIAVDEGTTAEKVAIAGLDLAMQLNAEVALISVVDTTFLMTEGTISPVELAAVALGDLKKHHGNLIEKIFKTYKVQSFVKDGIPDEAILKVANEWSADLIVLGTHGRTGLSHLLMGSIAEKVMRHSAKPLFIIPTK